MTIALVIASAFLHALWNMLLRLERDKERALVAAVAVATLVAAAVAAVRIALGAVAFAGGAAIGWAIAAGITEWLYFASLARALDRGPLGPVYTVSRGGAIIVVWPASIVLFHEPITATALAGSVLVLGGLALSSHIPGDSRATRGNALAWALACAGSIAGYHLAYKAALDAGGNPSAIFALALAVASAINLVRLGGEGRAAARALVRQRGPRILLMGIVCGGSFLILMEALHGGGAGLVLTLRNTSVLFAIALAAAIGERPRRAQIAGALAVAAGAIVMSI